jgi:hypothetical protein
MLDQPEWVGVGQNAEVKLHAPGVPNPERAQVEKWLRQKERAANLFVILTLIFASIGAVGSIIAAWPIMKEWLK